MQTLKFVKSYFLKNKKKYFLYVSISLILSLLSISSPLITGRMLDSLLATKRVEVIYFYSFFYAIIAIFQIVFSYFLTIVGTKLNSEISFQISQDTIVQIQKANLKLTENMDSAYTVQRINLDANSVTNFSLSFSSGLISNGILIIISFIYILVNTKLLAITSIFVVGFFALIYRYKKKVLDSINYKFKESYTKYFSTEQNQLRYLVLIKINSLYQHFYKKLNSKFIDYYKILLRKNKTEFLFKSSDLMLSFILQIVLFLYGGIQILNGILSIGTFTVISSYLKNMIAGFDYFATLSTQMIESDVSVQRIKQYFLYKTDLNGEKRINDINEIKVSDLSFKFNDIYLINNLNLILKKGNIYKISGENGKGKTTLLFLLIGLYAQQYQGDIFYNHININELDMDYIRKNYICFITQLDYMINDSFLNNFFIDFNSGDERKKLNNLCEHYSLTYLINRYSHNTEIVSDDQLSGGEKKKINIIRGMLKSNKKIILLDETNVFLDEKSRLTLKNDLKELKKENIIILVSHEEYFDDIVDEIIYL